jgi:hypothetical protein
MWSDSVDPVFHVEVGGVVVAAGLLDVADMVGAPGDQGFDDGQQGAAERGPL